MEETYIVINLDGVQRGLVTSCSTALIIWHRFRPFFPKLIDNITSVVRPVVCVIVLLFWFWINVLKFLSLLYPERGGKLDLSSIFKTREGVGVLASAWKLIRASNPLLAESGNLRGAFSCSNWNIWNYFNFVFRYWVILNIVACWWNESEEEL